MDTRQEGRTNKNYDHNLLEHNYEYNSKSNTTKNDRCGSPPGVNDG